MPDIHVLLARTLVIVAHPDDEAAGCGVLLQRMREPAVLFATDGAPEDPYFWGRYGSREAYGEMRREEARRALALGGVRQIEFLGLPDRLVTDQQLFRSLPRAFEELLSVVERIRPDALLTLTYEGGHPDHDSCSFLTAQVAQTSGLPAWEFPIYHRSSDGLGIKQHFMPSADGQVNDSEIVIEPTPAELKTKKQMLATYASQGVLTEFPADNEFFRPQARYDYSRPPHEGVLNYEAWGWPIKGREVSRAFVDFMNSRNSVEAGR